MIRSILQYPNDILRAKAKPCIDEHGAVHPDLADCVRDLRDTFAVQQNCIGLAAPQIGILLRVVIVATVHREPNKSPMILIDPVIEQASADTQAVQDGCMSVSHGRRFAFTYRPKRITVTWIDDALEKQRQKFSGFIAACVHHEVDHLDGVLFIDRVRTR